MKDATEKTQKKAVPLTHQGPAGTSTCLRATLGTANEERTASPADMTYTHPELINAVQEGQNVLENCLLLVLEGAMATTASLSSALFQILALAKIPREVVQAIWSVVWLLDKIEGDAVAATAWDAMNCQLSYMNDELKTMTDHFHTELRQEISKQMETMAFTIRTSSDKDTSTPSTHYRDAILRQHTIPEGIDPRVLARVGIRA